MLDTANLFDRFGGVRPMAEKLRRPPSTVQSWKTAGRVPATEQPAVLARAEELGLDVIAIDVIFPLAERAAVAQPLKDAGAYCYFAPAIEMKRGDA